MRKVICDFCVSESPADPRNEEEVMMNTSLPSGWIEWKVLVNGRPLAAGQTKLMCPSCCEERNIVIKPHHQPTLPEAILEELYDGIRDICSDAIGDAQ